MPETVAILGASNKPERYAYKALKKLQQYGHKAIPINPKQAEIEGTPCFASLAAYPGNIDTITLYVSPNILTGLMDDIIAIKPARVIMNPGTESTTISQSLTEHGIRVQQACTLILLDNDQFEQ